MQPVENQIPGSALRVLASTREKPATQKQHFHTIDALRGIAALSVAWFHFTNAEFTEQFGAYRSSGAYGFLGVEVFFVISGFIIPFALYQARYRVQSFFRFFLRRIVRLDPPYLASIAMVLFTLWFSGTLPGRHPYHIAWGQVLAHLGYVNAFIGMSWLQMTYWSLAVEFQYYVFVGLLFPLIALRDRIATPLILALFGAITWAGGGNVAFLPHYLPLFAIGILAFRRVSLKAPVLDTAAGLAASTVMAWVVNGVPEAIAAAAAAAIILWLEIDLPVLSFLGEISYSVYLMHVFVGNVVFGTASRYAARLGPAAKWYVPFVALALTLGVSYLLNRIVEQPSRRLAARISYNPKPAADSAVGVAAAPPQQEIREHEAIPVHNVAPVER